VVAEERAKKTEILAKQWLCNAATSRYVPLLMPHLPFNEIPTISVVAFKKNLT